MFFIVRSARITLQRACWSNISRPSSEFSRNNNYWRSGLTSDSQSHDIMTSIDSLHFDNSALKYLPIDEIKANYRRQVHGACFSPMELSPVGNPETVIYSKDAMELLGIDDNTCKSDDFPEYFSGNKKLNGSTPAAHCYCGHQFGYFSGQLGDGAAMYLGEIVNSHNQRWELQLKGSGPTPFSRQGDGRKVLRSSLREFLCSEALYYLGVPTTRAGSCITSSSTVIRDIFYNGNAKHEKVTIISRIAETFLRFGSFEIFKDTDRATGRSGPSKGRSDILVKMLDYTVSSFYPQIAEECKDDKNEIYLAFFREIVKRTAKLVAQWQCIGFCHGVLNTDNMSVVGVTIDYGPFGFMDAFKSDFICNASDDQGRYSYENQPSVCKWNCKKFAEAIALIVPLDKTSEIVDKEFDKTYNEEYTKIMKQKLGLPSDYAEEDTAKIISSFMETMGKTGADFTNSFRYLSKIKVPKSEAEMSLLFNSDIDNHAEAEMLASFCQTQDEQKQTSSSNTDASQLKLLLSLMQSNPGLAANFGLSSTQQLENQLKELEFNASVGDRTNEEKQENDVNQWMKWIASYKEILLKAKKSRSTDEDMKSYISIRQKEMNSINPRFILRNYIAQNAIVAAEEGDYSEAWKVLSLLKRPYDDQEYTEKHTESTESNPSIDFSMYTSKPPNWALDLKVT